MAGRIGLTAVLGSTTDDRGTYRVATLTPDRYVVVLPSTATTIPASIVEGMFRAAGDARAEIQQAVFDATSTLSSPGSAPNQLIGDVVLQVQNRVAAPPMLAADGSLAMYPMLFYSQVPTAADATTIELAAGETRTGIDFQIRPLPTVRVSGIVSGPDGPVGMLALRLVRPGADQTLGSVGFEVATTVADASGAFTFLGVPPGQFVVRALKLPKPDSRPEQSVVVQTPSGTASRGGAVVGAAPAPGPPQPTLWADQDLAIGDRDVTGLRIVLRTGFRLSGRLEFEGTSPHQPPPRFAPYFESADRVMTGRLPEVAVASDGTFLSVEVPRGQYRLSIPTPSGWFVKSARFEGRDLSDLPFDLNQTMEGGDYALRSRRANQRRGARRPIRARSGDGSDRDFYRSAAMGGFRRLCAPPQEGAPGPRRPLCVGRSAIKANTSSPRFRKRPSIGRRPDSFRRSVASALGLSWPRVSSDPLISRLRNYRGSRDDGSNLASRAGGARHHLRDSDFNAGVSADAAA